MLEKSVIKHFRQDLIAGFNKTASDYVKYRQGFPEEFFHHLIEKDLCDYDDYILDIGTGTGTIARGMAQLGFHTFAIDPAEDLIEEAKKLDAMIDVNVEYFVEKAEKTSFENDFFQLILAGQCWHWLDQEKAIREIKRIAKTNAKLVIAYFDWLPLNGSVAQATEKLIKHYNPDWSLDNSTGFYPEWAMQLSEYGFSNVQTYTFTKDRYFTHEEWCGRVRASAGVGAALSAEKVKAFNQEHKELLQKNFPQESLIVTHRCFTLIADIPKSKEA